MYICNSCNKTLLHLFKEEENKMNCRQCGQPLPEGTAFCSGCGAKQDISTQSSVQPQVQPQAYYEVKVKQKKKKNPIVPVILNLIAAVLFIR